MSERGQMTVDYVVGITIFLLTVGLVFTFVPLSFDPVRTEWGTEAMTADRAVSHLTGSNLTDNAESPFVLNKTKTQQFFAGTGSLSGYLGLPGEVSANVTLENGTAGIVLNRGPTPSTQDSVVVAQRSVLYDGSQYRLIVRVW